MNSSRSIDNWRDVWECCTGRHWPDKRGNCLCPYCGADSGKSFVAMRDFEIWCNTTCKVCGEGKPGAIFQVIDAVGKDGVKAYLENTEWQPRERKAVEIRKPRPRLSFINHCAGARR